MTEEGVTRKLAAIVYADVAGYSRLTDQDEEGTHKTLGTYLDLISAAIERRKGRVVHYAGDAILAEFGSAVVALKCAVEVQRDLAVHNEGIPEDRKFQFRIGVNLGDVIVDRDDIYGDGVNVAARLESLAQPGGICLSSKVLEEVRNKLEVGFEFLGEQSVKNIEKPIPVYRVLLAPEAAGQIIGEQRARPKTWQWAGLAVSIVFIVAGAVAVAVWLRPWEATLEPVSEADMAFPLPDKPSIAVLPFANLTGDPGKEYLSDGITEDIITDLSKFPQLFVIARTSVFSYKDKPATVQQISEELGVRYVLEGSFRESDQKVRVTAQLIDATTGHHLWAERYDRDLRDLFALLDEITQAIVAAMTGQIAQEELARAKSKDTENLESYDLFLRGRDLLNRLTKDDNAEARKLFQRAIELDPEYARGYAGMALTHFYPVQFKWGESPAESLKQAFDFAKKAVELDASDYYTYQTLGRIYIAKKEYDQGLASYETALSLNPNDADLLASMGLPGFFSGRPEEAIRWVTKAMRLNPSSYPSWYPLFLGCSYYVARKYEEAVVPLTDSINRNPKALVTHSFLAASYGQLGWEKEAQEKVEDILKMNPKFSVGGWSKCFKFKDPADLEHYADGLRKAGLPE